MSLFHSKRDRRILPRWRLSSKASQATEFSALRPPAKVLRNVEGQGQQAADDFAKTPTIGSAAEALSYALLAEELNAAVSPAKFILENEDTAPLTLFRLAKSVIEGRIFNVVEPSNQERIAQTRKLLRINPDNPALWADMAQHHSTLGHKIPACRSMKIALQLAPNHRWMLRTAARFFVHQAEPIIAHKLLANHPQTRNDPWLLAAELACAQVAKRPTRFWGKAVDILKGEVLPPQHTSELATAVAMMELEAGAGKKARKYIKKGLVAPTENTLAQVHWARENKYLNDDPSLDFLIENAKDAFEADYHLNLVNGNLAAALSAAETWQKDEPYAARPCIEIVYVASLLDNYALSIEKANYVRRLDGRIDSNFEMNTIFAKLSSGKYDKNKDIKQIEGIRSKLIKVVDEDKTSYHAMANLGLWHYRYGKISEGHMLYKQAISVAQKLNHNKAASMAATYAAREAILAREVSADAVFQYAKELAKTNTNAANEFYLRKLDALSRKPGDVHEILSPATAHQFLKQGKQAPLFRVEKTRKGDILWIPRKGG